MIEYGIRDDCLRDFQRIVECKESCDAVQAGEDVRRIDKILRGCSSCCLPECVSCCGDLDKELRDRRFWAIWRFEAFLRLLPRVVGSPSRCGVREALRRDRAAIMADTLIKHELVGSLEECLEVRA